MSEISGAEKLIDTAPLPMVLLASDERLSRVNAPAASVFGETAAGRHYITVFRQPILLDCIELVLGGRADISNCTYLTTSAGREVSYRVTAAALDLSGDRFVLLSFVDTTEMQAAEQMRRDFVANVSHELRTPLTAVLGFIETLRSAARDDPDARDRFLGIMEVEASRMNRLVRDLLSLSRVEGEERIRPLELVDLSLVIDSAIETLRPIIDSSKATVEVIGTDGMFVVPGDPDQLSQVFNNLIENAIKYGGPDPEVTVTLSFVRHEPSVRGPAAVVSVKDNGAGFDPFHIPRITERFYRVDTHRSREMGGTGLGLAIVKHIVNRHRGRLRIDSTPGEGSEFTVILAAK